MILIIGLGNPGKKYENTRHNAGFLVLEKLKTEISKSSPSSGALRARGEFLNPRQITNLNFQTSKNAKAEYLNFRLGDEKVELIKPLTYMNESGFSVAYAKNKHKVPTDNIYIIHDDLDIRLGDYKIQFGKGPKEHNGLLSIYEKLGTKDFWHVRVGVDGRTATGPEGPALHRRGEEYVLQNFPDDEREILEGVIKDLVSDIIEMLDNNI